MTKNMVYYYYFCLALILASTATAAAAGVSGCSPSDLAALTAFRAALSEPYLGIFTSWKGADCCSGKWYGVSCDPTTGRVVDITLRGVSEDPVFSRAGRSSSLMSGYISPKICLLDRLSTLVVADWKQISGIIPSCVTSLPFLRIIDLVGNRPSRNLRKFKSVTKSTLSDRTELNIKVQAGGSSDLCMPKDVLSMGTNDFSDAKFTKGGRLMLESSLNISNKYQPFHSVVKDKEQPERDIHVSSEQLSTHVKHISEENTLAALPRDEPFSDTKHIGNSASVAVFKEEPCPSHKDQLKQFLLRVPPEDKELFGHFQADIMSQESGIIRFEECEQPSPVSVLEPPPAEEENSTSVCFERLNADLQELRMQLKLLKLEPGHTHANGLDMDISSDEDFLQENQSSTPALQTFRNEDDRDFSYLLDILIVSGIHCADWDSFSGLCNFLSFPRSQHIFEKLEKKYKSSQWSRSERKLLFDTVNFALSDLVTPCIDLHSLTKLKRSLHAWDRDGLVEGLWQMVVKKRNELGDYEEILYQRWSGFEAESECTVKQLERMLSDALLEELVAELVIA